MDRSGQPEVSVIARSAHLLIHHGTPYQAPAVLSYTRDPNVYDPYLPAMTAFGLLWAVAGPSPLADPRVWFGVAFVAVFALALRVAQAKDVARWTVFVTATPIIAFEPRGRRDGRADHRADLPRFRAHVAAPPPGTGRPLAEPPR